ncbi:MAG: hypothetical protein ACLRZ6_01135 [Lachnospiraceae bacterium]
MLLKVTDRIRGFRREGMDVYTTVQIYNSYLAARLRIQTIR